MTESESGSVTYLLREHLRHQGAHKLLRTCNDKDTGYGQLVKGPWATGGRRSDPNQCNNI